MRVSELLHKNRIWSATWDQMVKLQSAYLNGLQYKTATRIKRPSEDAALYRDVITHTAAQPIARYVVDTINDLVFEPGIIRRLDFVTPTGATVVQPWPQLFLQDADRRNTHLDGVMEEIADLSSIFGHCWVIVDRPPGDPNTTRPTVVPISPLHVWDWSWITVGGARIPECLKIMEWESDTHVSIKYYECGEGGEPTKWESWIVPLNAPPERELEPVATGELPPGMAIPAFIAYTKRDPRTHEFGISDIDIASDVQDEHYKLECEAYQALQFARTIIRAENGIKVPAHPGAIVRATQGQIETLTVDTGDVGQIIQKQGDLLTRFQELSGLGGLNRTSNQVASGVSIIEERRGLHRIARAKARQLEIAEEAIWTFAARFMGVRWAGEVSYNTDYESHDTAYRIALMERARTLVPDDPTVNNLILADVIRMLSPPDRVGEYLAGIAEEEVIQPETRDSGDQTPTPEEEDIEDKAEGDVEDSEGDSIGGYGTPIINTGPSYTTENAVAVQLGFGTGGGR